MLPCRHTLYHIEARYTEARFNPLARDPYCPKHPRDISSQRQANAKPGRATPKSWPQAFRRKDGKMVSVPPVWLSQQGRGSKHLRVLASLGKSWH